LPTRLTRQELLRFARFGAASRLAEIQQEQQTIEQLLGQSTPREKTLRRSSTIREAASASEQSRRTAVWSAAQRRAVSRRMKAYWAKRRAKTT